MRSELQKIENLPLIIKSNTEIRQERKRIAVSKRIASSLKIESSKILSYISQVPIIANALKVEKGFTAVIPENLREGIKNGTLKIMQGNNGSLISTIVDISTGKIVHQMRLTEFTKMVNPAELSQTMNQICMQMQLDEIQKELSEFHLTTNTKLNEIIKNFHENRIIPSDSVKLSFARYQKGEDVSKSQLLVKIDDAKAALLKDIKIQIASVQQTKNSINEEESKELQNKIVFILDDINNLQDLYFIEFYLNVRNEKKCDDLTSEYTEELLQILTKENIKLLDGYSNFSYLELKDNIWEKTLMPLFEKLSISNEMKNKFILEKK